MMETIVKTFDIRKMRLLCNFKDCTSRSEKSALIYNYTLNNGKKGLVMLYICSKHVKEIDSLIQKLREDNPKMIIDKDIKNIDRKER